ncbi:hypothetical protein AB4305_25610 [Nocardia sp. 2YAB30]|uniref:hypothetical protein n=1 Tax=unclassified Nocardia TaxID=2637762 RepID=UPI003F9614BA
MSQLRLSRTVIIGTAVYLAISFLSSDRPGDAVEWVRFGLMGAVFALLFGTGLLFLRRFTAGRS